MDTYIYTMKDGWRPYPGRPLTLPGHITDGEELGDWLYAQGFLRLAESAEGRCRVGHFYVWHQEEPLGSWPRYAVEIDQDGAEGVVWIDTLPDLWEFLRLYGQIGLTMSRLFPGDHEEYEGPRYPDCGEPMTREQEDTEWIDA